MLAVASSEEASCAALVGLVEESVEAVDDVEEKGELRRISTVLLIIFCAVSCVDSTRVPAPLPASSQSASSFFVSFVVVVSVLAKNNLISKLMIEFT